MRRRKLAADPERSGRSAGCVRHERVVRVGATPDGHRERSEPGGQDAVSQAQDHAHRAALGDSAAVGLDARAGVRRSKAVSAASLAKKLSRTLKIAKRADRNAKRAIAGLQNVGGGGAGGSGPPGPQGPKGDKGDPGTAANVGATGPQGPPGPKGDKGDTGDTGPQGPQGQQGPQGDQGPQGQQGQQGPQGIQGPQGVQGPAGFDSTFITTEDFTTLGGSFTTAIIDCPAGSTAVGGGYSVGDAVGNLFNVMQDRPVGDGSGWLIRMRSGAANPFSWTGWVVCA